jgi:hypothetical protein
VEKEKLYQQAGRYFKSEGNAELGTHAFFTKTKNFKQALALEIRNIVYKY